MTNLFYYYLKDGLPSTIFQKIIAHNYLLVDIAILISLILMLIYFRKIDWKWKTCFIVCPLSISTGLFWGALMLKYDSNFPGWTMLPWGTIGNIWVWPIEDFIFYIITTFFFYMILRLVLNRQVNDFQNSNLYKLIFFFSLLILTIFMLLKGALCGRILCILYAIPSLIMFTFIWNKINSKIFLTFFCSMVLFEVIWDLAAVSWIYHIKSWLPGWIYLTYDNLNVLHSSKVFLNPNSCKWGWIFNNPIENTPWYGITGTTFIYSFTLTIDKIFKEEKKC